MTVAPNIPARDVHVVPVGLLNPAEYNPRLMTEKDAEDLRTSLVRFGMVDPLIVNMHPGREHVVVGGHQRLRIAIELGWPEVPVVLVDLPLAQERELNLRLNKNLGRWDWDVLANRFEISELVEVGFTDQEIGLVEAADLPDMQPGKREFETMSLHVPPADAELIRATVEALKNEGAVTREGIGNELGRAVAHLCRGYGQGDPGAADRVG